MTMKTQVGALFLATTLSGAVVASAQDALNPTAAPRAAAAGTKLRDVLINLSPKGRRLFIEEWLKLERIEVPQRRAALNAAQERALAAITAEPFNADALRKAYADQRDVILNNHRTRQERLISVLSRLSPEDRRLVVEQLRALRERQAEP